MSIKVMSRVWECSKAEGSRLLLLLAIADYADDKGVAYPKIAQLAQKCRQGKRTVSRQIEYLKSLGELEVKSQQGGRGTRSLYRVTCGETMPKWHGLEEQNHATYGMTPMPFGAQNHAISGMPIHASVMDPSCNHHVFSEKSETPRRKKKKLESVPRNIKKKSSPIPEEFQPTEDMLKWASDNCPLVNVQAATEQFRDHHLGEGTEAVAWEAKWRGWMRNAQKFAMKGSNDGTDKQAAAERGREALKFLASLK